jgi:hypothetical protein
VAGSDIWCRQLSLSTLARKEWCVPGAEHNQSINPLLLAWGWGGRADREREGDPDDRGRRHVRLRAQRRDPPSFFCRCGLLQPAGAGRRTKNIWRREMTRLPPGSGSGWLPKPLTAPDDDDVPTWTPTERNGTGRDGTGRTKRHVSFLHAKTRKVISTSLLTVARSSLAIFLLFFFFAGKQSSYFTLDVIFPLPPFSKASSLPIYLYTDYSCFNTRSLTA